MSSKILRYARYFSDKFSRNLTFFRDFSYAWFILSRQFLQDSSNCPDIYSRVLLFGSVTSLACLCVHSRGHTANTSSLLWVDHRIGTSRLSYISVFTKAYVGKSLNSDVLDDASFTFLLNVHFYQSIFSVSCMVPVT